jgi:cyclopropane fatty-acyl-phospholipid synthase-like methyltransferase
MKVLELGCGNSQLCEELYKDGVTEITCIDLSAIAVEKMQKRLALKGYKGVLLISLSNPPFSYCLYAYIKTPFSSLCA